MRLLPVRAGAAPPRTAPKDPECPGFSVSLRAAPGRALRRVPHSGKHLILPVLGSSDCGACGAAPRGDRLFGQPSPAHARAARRFTS